MRAVAANCLSPSWVSQQVLLRQSSRRQQPFLNRSVSQALQFMTIWQGNQTQEELMLKDQCILVDPDDKIIGHSNKYDCHRFLGGQPNGLLHRAFSVFLFNSSNQLLLQQRASTKITFPSFWTNTCCSHPLYGQIPQEVDAEDSVSQGRVPGVITGAIRKLEHELGIPKEQLNASQFKYLTRLHYCAPDSHTWGPAAEWGEHEIDYILFIRTDVELKPNPEEVGNVKYVNEAELEEMMKPDAGLLWTPWFRIIAKHFLHEWWQNLDDTLQTNARVNYTTIHKLSA